MIFKRKKAESTPPEQIRRIVTTGFASSTMKNAETFFVETEKHDDGKYVLYATNSYGLNGQGGFRRQVLTEHYDLKDVMRTMNEWERLNRTQFAVSGLSTGRSALHYSAVARQMGVAIGPEMVSEQHARRMKHVIAARRNAPRI